MHRHSRLFLSLMLTVGIAPFSPVYAWQDCRYVDFGGRDVSYCQEVCRTTPLQNWLARWSPRPNNPPGWSGRPSHRSPQSVNDAPRPYKITSCKATSSPDIPGGCRITVCGPVLTPKDMLRATRNIDKIDNRVLTPKPRIGPPSPGPLERGLMDNGGGIARQNPAAIGTPIMPNVTRGGNSSGGGLR